MALGCLALAAARCFAGGGIAAAAPAAHAARAARRAMSGAAATPSVVDQMLAYARKEGGQAAVDVVRSGLAMQPDPGAGVDASRLLLVASELSAAQADWVRRTAARRAERSLALALIAAAPSC
ncbi:MAG: hypothetical protein J3K34DRAFT_409948 [Monoraphidium minutum]|nr:MAG: hypothetical protein J3K34DRAFT_409948 [Monoraphidium minutum]